ncbi:hypothetical protein NL108_007323 [Boleophthalmus pectinirostris]|uniref:uncharacterized protein LOC110169674 n=1 Tax=Boleophthalmus pectinirostris TaxID=150288 RepID=UPI00242A6350|nr:uncharacterized protein LOC110169674 [Boleophthalmus pectinirostris]XP_055008726.1 uncharacterized protein LOC110169674 [Boleophthalmus pectinirostris]KAJ0058053.1 hypothetical protein NL108_007323 [Boleophthalmus pectinirostris]
MESYEQFCLQTLSRLQDEGKFKKLTREPLCSLKAQSLIQFHGRPILPPHLTAEQRHAMCNYRQQAVQLEVQKQSQQRNRLIARVQDLLDQTQTKDCGVTKVPSGNCPTISGYTLVTDSPGLTKDYLAASFSHTSIVSCNKEKEIEKERTEEQSEEEDDEDEEDISLDSLLKKSREYVKQEGKVMHTAPPDNAPLDTKISNSTTVIAFSLRHSPVGQMKIQNQPPYDPILPQPCSSSSISPDQHIHLQVKDFCPSLCAQKRRPRPISTGNIHFTFPIEPSDLIPRSPGRSAEGAVDQFFSTTRSTHHRASLGEDNVTNCQSSQGSNHPTVEPTSPNNNVICSPNGYPESSQFRRRCHTLDSQLQRGHSTECINRSQERVPRFMAGVTWLGPNRRLPVTPVNQSYTTECPSTSKPSVTPDSPSPPKKVPEAQTRDEATQRQAQTIEGRQRHVLDEHTLHMSQLLAEQEREQQRLLLEQEHVEKRLKEQLSRRPLSADASGWSHTCPIISPSCPHLSPAHHPSERSPGHSFGFPNPAISPSVLLPITTWGPNWTSSKSRTRLSEVITPELHRAYCRICAIARGFLTRQLLKTEKIKQLRQTVVDTQAFICSFQTEAPQKKVSYTSQDLSLQERVRAQLRVALYDIHDIFFQIPLLQRLGLLQQDRELRLERKLRDMEKTKSSKDKILSAATQRSIDRKKRVGESPAQTRKVQQKPKSPTTNRVLKPSQGQNSPAMGRLNRQGSWYKKTPEERVRKTDSLKKQHSLG